MLKSFVTLFLLAAVTIGVACQSSTPTLAPIVFKGNATWTVSANIHFVSVLVVGGGAGGGGGQGGGGYGGGGGQYLYNDSYAVTPGANITVAIGDGGLGGTGSSNGSSGGNSTFGTLTAIGGNGTATAPGSNGNTGQQYSVGVSTVIGMGDSLSYSNYQPILCTLLDSSTPWLVVTKGVPGDITSGMLSRFSTDVLSALPEYVIVWGGTNDIARSSSAASIESNLQSMYTDAHNDGIKVVAVNIAPSDFNSGQQAVLVAVNTWIANTATNVDYRIDVYSVLNDPNNPGNLLAAYDSGDHIHLNAAGYSIVANTIYNGASWTAGGESWFGGNGGGGVDSGEGGSGGRGGAGSGASTAGGSEYPLSGAPNTGGGGGGSGWNSASSWGGNGGSGIVVVNSSGL
jgi:lysophospholipase L1-like esterase